MLEFIGFVILVALLIGIIRLVLKAWRGSNRKWVDGADYAATRIKTDAERERNGVSKE